MLTVVAWCSSRSGWEFQSGWADDSSRRRRERRPRQRRVPGGGGPAVSLGRLARRASGGHRWVTEVGGAPSDAPVGRPRTPNVPARARGVGGGRTHGAVRASVEGRWARAAPRRAGARVDGELRAPVWVPCAARGRRDARIRSIIDAWVIVVRS
jgi:hypothetical protein